MIFTIDADNLQNGESYKERNLYYKIFAGFLFNELVEHPTYEVRKAEFCKLLLEKIKQPESFFGDKQIADNILIGIQSEVWKITFDYHPAQIFPEDKRDNRGEMSDILIMAGKHMLSIECKFLSDINYDKDVIEVQDRIIKFSEHFKIEALQIFILKKDKWNNSKRIRKELLNKPQIPLLVLFWEDILLMIEGSKMEVADYLKLQIGRKK